MKFVGVDLHKKTISVCVMVKASGKRKVVCRKRFYCDQPELIQAAWRLVNTTARWGHIFERLHQNTGSKKKAIVGVARRVLCVMFAMLRDGKRYNMAAL